MRDWYKYETGNEQERDKLCRHLRKLKVEHKVEDLTEKMGGYWWRVKVLITRPEQLTNINAWLNAN